MSLEKLLLMLLLFIFLNHGNLAESNLMTSDHDYLPTSYSIYEDKKSYSNQSISDALDLYSPNDSFPGYTLFAPEYYTLTFLIDNDGNIVNMWKSKYAQALGTYLLENGNLIRACSPFNNPYFPFGGVTGRLEVFDWNNTLIWEYERSTNKYCLHHDVEVLSNGNILLLSWEIKSVEETISAGRNPDLIPWNYFVSDSIIEIQPTGPNSGRIVWEWHVWDHLIQDYDSTKNNYGIVSQHPELIDINLEINDPDYFHINSIDYNPDLDQIMLTVRNYNEIWIIDHDTTTEEAAGHTGGRYGKGGDLLYRWGNPQTYRAGTEEDQKLFRPHDGQWIEEGCPGEGNILVFNNGLYRSDGLYSTIEEFIPPVDENGYYRYTPGLPYGPEDSIWSYGNDREERFFSELLSGAQRLPNGNTLICEGKKGHFFEVTMDKEIVWEYTNPYPSTINDVFKIRRYPLNYSGLGPLQQYNPMKPVKPEGPTNGESGIYYTYYCTTRDPNNENLYYTFDWGDGKIDKLIGPIPSGERVSASHMWETNGTYKIRVKAVNKYGLESSWSDPLQVNITTSIAWLFGKISDKNRMGNNISFWADYLYVFSFHPFSYTYYPNGAYVIVDVNYVGILTNRFVAGKFYIRSIR